MKKGQEEAPIELLIGVAIMTFVLIIGIYAYQNMCTSQYEQSMKAALSKFARDIELVYMGSVGTVQITQVDFSVPIACGASIESVRMLQGSKESCMMQVGREDCLVLVVITGGDPATRGVLISEVLDIPSDVAVINKLDTNCGKDLSDIEYDTWKKDLYEECWFGPQQYTIKIKKNTQTEIELSGVT